jgi:signal peptidase I
MKLSPDQKQKWLHFYHEWVEPFVAAIILALVIRTFFVQPFKIPTGSMRPTLIEGDRILVNKLLYRFREPVRGDVLVFKYPPDRKRDFIKRLVAGPNETLRIEEGRLYVDDEQVMDPEVFQKIFYYNKEDWPYGRAGESIEVPEENYFVLGDNSANSSDSRNWGYVDRKDLVGRAFLVYWPPSRIKKIQ